MGMMMPETCWVNLKWINVFTCVIRWFFPLLCCYMFRDAVRPREVNVINTFEINVLPQGRDDNYFLSKYCLFLLEVSGRRHTVMRCVLEGEFASRTIIVDLLWLFVCNPWYVLSRLTSRHHWIMVNMVMIAPIPNKLFLCWWNHLTF